MTGLLAVLLFMSDASLAKPSHLTDDFWGWNSPEAVQSTGVRYVPTTHSFNGPHINFEGYTKSIPSVQQIGVFVSGKYKGGDLLMTTIFPDDSPCKGDECGAPERLMFVKQGSTVTYLESNSQATWIFKETDWKMWRSAFSGIGFVLEKDEETEVSPFLEPWTISNSSVTLNLFSNHCTSINSNQLKLAFHHETFRDVYFDQNLDLFYIPRPDGTCLSYEYRPNFSPNEIVWMTPPVKPIRSDYSWKSQRGYGAAKMRYECVVSSDLLKDLKVAGRTPDGDSIYELKEKDHPLINQFFEDYEQDFENAKKRTPEKDWPTYGDHISINDGSYYISLPKRSKDQFLAAKPIFFWRDPFGRLLRFTNNDFLPIYMAEPIIYLYPETRQRVQVIVDPGHPISVSTPAYRDGWDVWAEPSGKLTNTSDGKKYPYLFWEGFSSVHPMREEGFLVAQKGVDGFFKEILSKLGLNEGEIGDFLRAWMPRFKESPYYFITFYPQQTIDQLAPLRVTPKPDTVIRVLMDYRPLQKPEDVKEPQFTSPPVRKGFTVIEWGGIQR